MNDGQDDEIEPGTEVCTDGEMEQQLQALGRMISREEK